MTFKDRVALTLLARGTVIGIGILSSVVTARWLGPEGRGVLATLSVVTGLALQFGNLGLHSGNTYYVARDPRTAAPVLGNALWLSVALGVASGGAAVAARGIHPSWFAGIPSSLVLVTAAVLPFQFMTFFFQNALLGMHEVRAFNYFEVTNKTLTFAALAAYLLLFSGGVRGAVVLFALAGTIFGAASVLYCRRRVPFGLAFDRELFARMLPYGGKIYVSCFLSFVVIRSDMLLVNYYLGTAAAGVYSIAAQIADSLLLLPVTIGMILMPRIASEAPERQDGVTARVARHAALLLTFLCATAYLLVGPVVSRLYGAAFADAIPATRWLLPGVWALGIHGILMNHFAGQGLPWVVIGAPLAGVLANLALNLRLIPAAGIVGASIASSVAYALMLGIVLVSFRRRSRAGLRETLVIAPDEIAGLLGMKP